MYLSIFTHIKQGELGTPPDPSVSVTGSRQTTRDRGAKTWGFFFFFFFLLIPLPAFHRSDETCLFLKESEPGEQVFREKRCLVSTGLSFHGRVGRSAACCALISLAIFVLSIHVPPLRRPIPVESGVVVFVASSRQSWADSPSGPSASLHVGWLVDSNQVLRVHELSILSTLTLLCPHHQ